jgi:predicted small metal-binding protein
MDGDVSSRADELACDCGYVAHGADDDELVAVVQAHAWDVHGIKLSADLILAMAGTNGATAQGAASQRERDPAIWLSTQGRLQ